MENKEFQPEVLTVDVDEMGFLLTTGVKGDKGEPGERGENGDSITTKTNEDGSTTFTVTDAKGVIKSETTVRNGKDGSGSEGNITPETLLEALKSMPEFIDYVREIQEFRIDIEGVVYGFKVHGSDDQYAVDTRHFYIAPPRLFKIPEGASVDMLIYKKPITELAYLHRTEYGVNIGEPISPLNFLDNGKIQYNPETHLFEICLELKEGLNRKDVYSNEDGLGEIALVITISDPKTDKLYISNPVYMYPKE